MGGMHQLESSKPGSGWQNPPPPAELLKAAAHQPAFLSLHVPRWFLFVFPESVSDGWVTILGGEQEKP